MIDSSVNNGKVALGASPPTSHTSGNGFYADGTGKFLVGNTSGNFIQFNGTQIIIKAPDFFFGDATNFISGSNGNMSIQSGNFELDANNIEISSTQASMSLGEGKIILQGASTSTIKVADKFLISSDGTDEFLAIGDKTSFTHFDQSTAGIIMGMDDTTTKFEVVGNASNYLSFNGTSFDLNSQTFDLDAGTIIVDSSGDGTIKLGSSATSITETANTGVFIDGGGKFRVGSGTSGDNFIHFNGSQIIMKSPDFLSLIHI